MMTIALKRRAEEQSVVSIAEGLIIPIGKNAGKLVGKSALYEALRVHDEQRADGLRRERATLAAALPELDDCGGMAGGHQLGVRVD
ncbi:hypothetical protein ACFXKJ_36165 [Kitasatospora indigofera]|uniref:hypothetical protein n=1 Tax=Kitasatospora indigofera TaxID=67307 RepID=UPI0036C7F53B